MSFDRNCPLVKICLNLLNLIAYWWKVECGKVNSQDKDKNLRCSLTFLSSVASFLVLLVHVPDVIVSLQSKSFIMLFMSSVLLKQVPSDSWLCCSTVSLVQIP